MNKHILDGRNTFCSLCGSHKGCPACEIQNPMCPDAEDGKHIWQEVKVKAFGE